MTKRNILKAYGLISIIIYALCIGTYFYLRRELVPELTEITPLINIISGFIIITHVIIGIYHLVMLVNGLKNLTGRFIFSIYISLVIISGITLLSDAAQLSDIGKEYLYFDIASQWNILMGFAFFHLITMIVGTIILWKSKIGEKLFRPAMDNEELFMSIHQIGLITGVLGLAGTIITSTGILVPERYTAHFMVFTAGLVMAPSVLFATYWILKLRKKPLNEWLDEMQVKQAATAAIISLALSVPIYILAVISQILKVMDYGTAFWVLVLAFVQITIYSLTVLIRKR